MKKVLVIAAHDDDAILGVGGLILRLLADGNDVRIIICHDGRTSHRAVFQREERPNLRQVAKMRFRETRTAMELLGVNDWEVLNLPGEEGRPSQNLGTLEAELRKRLCDINPHEVYYHLADAHPDHRAVAEVVGEIMDTFPEIKASQFMIWTKDLAQLQGQSNMDATQAPAISDDALLCGVSKEHLKIKRRALHCMASQVQAWPYPEWDPQPKAVLNDIFLKYFLRGEEIIVPINWIAG